ELPRSEFERADPQALPCEPEGAVSRIESSGSGPPCVGNETAGQESDRHDFEPADRRNGIADGPALLCPDCGRPLDAKRACWRCCQRLCACGRATGTAFISVCRLCEVASGTAGSGEE